MVNSQTVKFAGFAVGALLFAYALLIAKAGRYGDVSDKYASAFSTVGLVIITVAAGGFTRPPINLVLEAGGYVIAAVFGTVAFRRIANNQRLFKRA